MKKILEITLFLALFFQTIAGSSKNVIINQVYGGGNADGSISHSFIELYNTTDNPVSLDGWSLQLVGEGTSKSATLAEWKVLPLTGAIPAHSSYLIRGNGKSHLTGGIPDGIPEGPLTGARYIIGDVQGVDYDKYWDVYISNRAYKVALVNTTGKLSESNPFGNPAVIDLIGATNDGTDGVDAYEGSFFVGMSKQKAVRRTDFIDTDNNVNDFKPFDYRTTGISDIVVAAMRPLCSADGTWTNATDRPVWPAVPPVTPGVPNHLIINQAAGVGKNADGALSHSFVEIYNPTDATISLEGLSLQYAPNGTDWSVLKLTGEVPSKHSYLVRANGSTAMTPARTYTIYYADQNWNMIISNDYFKFALVQGTQPLTVFNPPSVGNVIDLIGADNSLRVDFGEGGKPVVGGISKQKSVRRVNFGDTDNNTTDFSSINYSSINEEQIREFRPRSLKDGVWEAGDKSPIPTAPVTNEIIFGKPAGLYETAFNLTLDFNVSGNADISNYEIRYTLDGEDPKAGPNGSSIYNGTPLLMQDLTAIGGAPLSQIPNTSTSNGGATHDWYINPSPSNVFQGTVVKAQLFTKDGTPASDVYINSYFVNSAIFSKYGKMPVISISTPKEYFFDPNIGIYVIGNGSIPNWDNDWERPVHFEMFEQKGNSSERVIAQGMGVRIHGSASRSIAQKTLRFYTRTGLVENLPLLNGSPTINYDLFKGTYGDAGIKRFQLRGHSNDAQRALIRDPFSAVIASDLDFDTEDYRPAVMFLNGEFWGVYQIRERFDDEYLAQHYGPDKNNYGFIEDPSTYYYGYTDPSTGAFYNVGGMTAANNGTQEEIDYYLNTVGKIDNFIATKGINTPETYAEIEKYVDIDNLIDYTILRTFIGDNDWVNKARPVDLQTFGKHQLMWRYTGTPVNGTKQDGRYRWMHKDGDFAFQGPEGNVGGGNSANTGVHGMAFNSIAVIIDENPENYFFFNRLINNDIFREKFINRYRAVLNTSFSIDNLNSILYRMKAEIDPAMDEHFLRWSYNNRANWESEINRISSNLALRTSTNPDVSGITRGLNLLEGGDPATLTIRSYGGNIKINGVDIKPVSGSENWSGQYRAGLTQTIEAVPATDASFTKFIITENTSGKSYESTKKVTDIKMVPGGITVMAVFGDAPPANIYNGLIILQAYGAGTSEDGSISHSFIELYNTTDQPILMDGISLQYSGLNEARTALTGWEMIKLSGEIPAKTSYLIRANGHYNTATNRYEIYAKDGDGKTGYDLYWNVVISNRLMMFALVDHQQKLTTYDKTAIPGLISSIASYNASADLTFMGANWNYIGNVTKQKTVLRVDFGESLEAISYRSLIQGEPSYNGTEGISDETLLDVRPCSLADGPWPPRPSLPTKVDVSGMPIIEFSKVAGLYESQFELELSTPSNYTIRYTTDGEDPTGNSDVYTNPLTMRDRTGDDEILSRIPGTVGLPDHELALGTYVPPANGTNFKGTVVKARLFDENGQPVSPMYINSYFVNGNMLSRFGGLPVISISTPKDNFFDPAKGIYMYPNFLQTGADWERPVFFEMFDANGIRVMDQGMGVRMQGGDWNRGDPQKSLRFYARTGNLVNGMPIFNGKSNVEYDLFQGKAIDGLGNPLTTGFTRFMLRSAGNDLAGVYNIYLGAFMRDALSSVLTSGYFNYETMAYRPSVAFINGEFWGLYNIRQRYDDEYLALAHGGDKNNYTILEGPVLNYITSVDQGTQADSLYFLNTVRQVWNMNLTDDKNYKYVTDNIVDEKSVIDYVITETFIANRDWAATQNNNQRIWRYTGTPNLNVPGQDGKYRWMLYDTDESYGGGADPRYPWPVLTTDDQDVLDKLLGNGKENLPFFTKLWENPHFRDKFINRYMDALNTCLQSNVTVPVVTGMEAAIDKVMQADQKIRWNYSLNYQDWKTNVANIKTWLQGRASQDPSIGAIPVMLNHHAKNTELAELKIINTNGGYTVLNGMKPIQQQLGATNGNFTGNYFVGYSQTLTAVPDAGVDFVKFIVTENATGNSYELYERESTVDMKAGGVTINAVFGTAQYFTVTFIDEDGSPLGSATIRQGDKATAPDVAEKQGFKLVSWVNATGEVFNLSAPIMGDITLKAVWKELSAIPEEILGPTQYRVAAYAGEANSLPQTVEVRFMDGSTGNAPIKWNSEPFLAAANYDMVTITGSVEGISATLTAVVEVIPHNLVYFIDAGLKMAEGQPDRTSSPAYDAVVKKLGENGQTLYNEVFDKFYNSANDSWGVIKSTINSSYIGVDGDPGLNGHIATDKLVSCYYGFNTFQATDVSHPDYGKPLYIEYKLNLPKGEYKITTGHYIFVDRSKITVYYKDGHYCRMNVLFNDQPVQNPPEPFSMTYMGETHVYTNDYTQSEDGELVIRFNTVDGDGALVSFIGVQDVTDRKTFEVTFDANNGTPNKVVTVNEGSKVAKPTPPVKEGYVFKGWYLDNTLFDFNTPITENITLTTLWEVKAIVGAVGTNYIAAYAGEANSLPAAVEVSFNDESTGMAAVDWDITTFLSAKAYDMINLTGTITGTNLTVTTAVEVIPRNLVYFIDAGLKMHEGQPDRTSSPAYDVVVKKLGENGQTLYNEVFDKFYNDANDKWGVIKETVNNSYIEGVDGDAGLDGHSATDKLVTCYYGWNTFQTINGTFLDGSSYDYNPDYPLYIEYRLNLPKGDYKITTGHYIFVDRSKTTVYYKDGHYCWMNVLFNGQPAQNPPEPFSMTYMGETHVYTNVYTQSEDGELVIRFNTVDGDGALVSFIGVQEVQASQLTVTFDSDGGSAVESQTVNRGEKAIKPANPVKENFLFVGWFEAGSETAFDFDTPITGNITLTAKYKPLHLIINQAFASNASAQDGAISNSFIELYNPTSEAVDLSTWSIQYFNSKSATTPWLMKALEGSILPYHSYLIISDYLPSKSARYNIPEADLVWAGANMNNDAFSFALVNNQTLLQNNTSDMHLANAEGVIDLVGASNTGTIYYWEGSPLTGKMSKQKSVRRIDFADTDNNLVDFESLDYRATGISEDKLALVRPRSSADGPWVAGDDFYTVTFNNDNGGEKVRVRADYNAPLPKPTVKPTKGGYAFHGWFLGDVEYDFNTLITRNITLTAKWGLYGDVNDDGRVNPLDVVLLTRYLTRWEGVEINLLNADVNDDGRVNPLDQIVLLRFLTKWEGYEILPYKSTSPSMLMGVSTRASNVPTINNKEDNSPLIRVSNAAGKVGDIVDVSINIENNPGIISMRLQAEYDASKLELVSVKNGTVLGALTQSNNQNNMPYTLFWPDKPYSSDITGNGEIAVLEFRIKEEITATPIAIAYDLGDNDICNSNLQPVSFTVVNGSVTSKTITSVNNPSKDVLSAYPNPVQRGHILKVEGVAIGNLIEVYNTNGMRVYHTIVTESPASLNLNVPKGIYILRANNREIKIVID